MIAIETKFVPATYTKPTRIVATAANGQRLAMSKSAAEHTAKGDHDDDVHRVVAQALADKMQWRGDLVCGGTKAGYVFVFIN